MSENLRKVNDDQVETLEYLASKMESQIDTRRRFIKKAIATAPVILTVTAGPVWAKARNCTRSGLISGNLSQVSDPRPCGGCTPGYWKNHLGNWPNSYDENSTWEEAMFCLNENYFPANTTLVEVLDNVFKFPASIVEQFAFHSVAALFNRLAADQGLKYIYFGYTVTDIRNMVCSAYSAGDEEAMKQVLELFTFLNEYNNEEC
jgi:hypothetical protein